MTLSPFFTAFYIGASLSLHACHCKNQHVHPDHNDDDHHPQDPFPKGKVWMLIVRSVMGASNLCVHFYGVKHMPIGGIILSNIIALIHIIIPTQILPIQNSNPGEVIGVESLESEPNHKPS